MKFSWDDVTAAAEEVNAWLNASRMRDGSIKVMVKDHGRYLEVAQTTFLEVLRLQHVLLASGPRFVNLALQLEFRRQMIQTFQPTIDRHISNYITLHYVINNYL